VIQVPSDQKSSYHKFVVKLDLGIQIAGEVEVDRLGHWGSKVP
jgi:hypothetical protein